MNIILSNLSFFLAPLRLSIIAWKEGEQRSGTRYKIDKELNRGAMAISYKAEVASGPGSGRKVFFKQYKSPSNKVSWYQNYIDYQKELKRRVEGDGELKTRCYEMVEFFENKGGKDASGVFYQVFEFVEGGKPLTDYIQMFRDDPLAVEWKNRVIFARVMMFAMDYLHKAKIVHTDLKPDNVFMIPGENNAGFRLKLIDMDFSIMSDRQAPWHGQEGAGYVGTPGYLSPEHLNGEVPQEASDIYTCGLILGELLGSGHPLAGEEDTDQATAAGRFRPVKIEQPINKVENMPFLECVINSCFEADPAKRPTARQLVNALRGDVFEWHAYDAESDSSAAEVGSAPVTPEPSAASPRPRVESIPAPVSSTESKTIRVELHFNDDKIAGCGVETVFGKRHFRGIHEDGKYYDNEQFKLYKDAGSGNWTICHISGATNETVVNGEKLEEPVVLTDGMEIAVGNTAKGVVKCPFTVRLVQG